MDTGAKRLSQSDWPAGPSLAALGGMRFPAPLYVAWETTHRCNAECVHCFSASGRSASRAGELSTEEGLDLVDQLAAAGVIVLALSGGEPLLRGDWSRLIQRGVDRGLTVNIGTNGSPVTERVAAELAATRVSSVTVSIDSHRAEVHDAFRSLPGLHRKAVLAVERLSRQGVRVVVGFTPTRRNWQDGPEVIELAIRAGASAVNLSEYVPAGRGTTELALSPIELRETLESWIRMRVEYAGRIAIIWHDCRVGMLVPESERRAYVGCGAGRFVARILPNGVVTPCIFLPTPIGSIRESTFEQLWQASTVLASFRQRQGLFSGNCGGCEFLDRCGGCRAVAYAYSGGDAFAGDPHCWISPDRRGVDALPDGEALPV